MPRLSAVRRVRRASRLSRVLLVGGAGFLGGHAARALLAAGHRVTVLTRGRRPTPAGAEARVADRRDAAACAAALDGLAFDLTVDFTAFDAADVHSVVAALGARLGRYTLISTGQVYLVVEGVLARDAVGAVRGPAAPSPLGEERSEGPLMAEPAAGTPDQGEWRYGAGKRRAEAALAAGAREHGIRGLALRLPIVLGEEDGSLRLWAYLERLLDGGPIVLPGGGRMARRFLHVSDLAAVLVRLAGGEAPPGSAYNLAQPRVTALREVLEQAAASCGASPRFVDATWEECERAGLGRAFSPLASPWASVLDPARAVAELGFVGTPLERYLPGVVRWHLEHRPASHPGYAERAREVELANALEPGLTGKKPAG